MPWAPGFDRASVHMEAIAWLMEIFIHTKSASTYFHCGPWLPPYQMILVDAVFSLICDSDISPDALNRFPAPILYISNP